MIGRMIQAPKVRRWAHDNALTLAFILVMFVVTWVMIMIDILLGVM